VSESLTEGKPLPVSGLTRSTGARKPASLMSEWLWPECGKRGRLRRPRPARITKRGASQLASGGNRRGAGAVFVEGELFLELLVRLAINLNVRVHKVIHRRPVLLWGKRQVAADGKLHAVRVQRAEEIIVLGRVLPGFGDVDGNPAGPLQVKLRPTMVAGDFTLAGALRQREADFEPGRDLFGAHHGDEHRVEVRAVAVPGVASPDGVPTAPARPRLVVAHGLENIVVKRARLPNGASLALGALLGERLQPSLHRNQSVRLQEPGQPHRGIVKLTVIAHQLVEIALGILLA